MNSDDGVVSTERTMDFFEHLAGIKQTHGQNGKAVKGDNTHKTEKRRRTELARPGAQKSFSETQIQNAGRSKSKYSIKITGLEENQKLQVGYQLAGNYVLQSRLGRGGMGEAWQAYDKTADRIVVIKLVPQDIQNAKRAMGRLKESFQRIHSLQHQHICPTHQLGEDDRYGYFLVMKFIDGLTLDEYYDAYMKTHRKFPISEVARLLWPIAKALDYAHDKKIIHRDIKPQNIMISERDGSQLIDFGLAAVIQNSLMEVTNGSSVDASGTMNYMAPEQWVGRTQDARTDQYGLAATVYELLSGHSVFVVKNAMVLRECAINSPVPEIEGIPEYANAALAKALSKDRRERFRTCREFIKTLANIRSKSKKAASVDTPEPLEGSSPIPLRPSRFIFDVDITPGSDSLEHHFDPDEMQHSDSGGSGEIRELFDSSSDSVDVDDYLREYEAAMRPPMYRKPVFWAVAVIVLGLLTVAVVKLIPFSGEPHETAIGNSDPVVENNGGNEESFNSYNTPNSNRNNGGNAEGQNDSNVAGAETNTNPDPSPNPNPDNGNPPPPINPIATAGQGSKPGSENPAREVISFRQEFRTANEIPSDRYKIMALAAIAEYQYKSGNLIGALENLEDCRTRIDDKIKDPGERSRAFLYLAKARAITGDDSGFAEAIRFSLQAAERIVSLPQKIAIFCEIAIAQDKFGDERGGPETLGKGLLALQVLDASDAQRILCTREIALTQIALEEYIAAGKTLESIPDPESRVVIYSELIARNTEAGNDEDRDASIAEAEKAIALIKDDIARLRSLVVFGTAMARINRTAELEDILKQAVEISNRNTTARMRDLTQSEVVRLLSEMRRFGDARKTAVDTISDRELRSRSLLQIVTGLVHSGDLDLAISVCEDIQHREHHCSALLEIANGRLDAGNVGSAKSLFNDALKEASGITIEEKRSQLIAEAVAEMARANWMENGAR